MTLVSDSAFRWIITVLTGGMGALVIGMDVVKYIKLRHGDRRDPLVRDRRFGYVMGIVIGAIGIWGCLRYHGVI